MIVYACADLLFATKIRSTAESLGVPTRPTRDAEALRRRLDRVDDGKRNDPVSAVLIDMDLEHAAIELIRLAKSHEASPPVVAFGAHVAVELLASASEAGADVVLPRGAFTANLPEILHRYEPEATPEAESR